MIEHLLNQTATYWPPGEPTGYGGYTWPVKVEIPVRWQEKMQMVRSKTGEERVSNAEVWTLVDIDLEGRIYRGTTPSPTPPMDPAEGPVAYEPIAKQELVGLDGEVIGWKVFL